jgi:hypothetical protein
MSETKAARADGIIRDSLPHLPYELRRRAELFLSRKQGRPRKVDKAECQRLRKLGLKSSVIATMLDCHPCNVFRALK